MGARATRPSVQGMPARAVQALSCIVAVLLVVVIHSAVGVPDRLLPPVFVFLCLILLAAAVWGIGWAIYLSILAAVGFSWMLPPAGRFTLHDARMAYALAAFAVVALIGDYLARRTRTQARKAIESEEELRDVMNAVPAHLWRSSSDGAVEFVNARWQEYTGFATEQALLWKWEATVHPDDRERFRSEWNEALASGETMVSEVRVRRADGQYCWWLVRNVPRRDERGRIVKWYGGGFEIEDRKRAEALLAHENRILEMVAKGESLAEILNALCLVVEEYAQGALASVLLLEGDCLRHGASPSLPRGFTDAIDGARIGESAGSCGTAAYRHEQVIVDDIARDPLWADYREAALSWSLQACWSTPVFSSRGEVIATFAMYYREPRRPSQDEQEMIRQIAHLAGIAVERKLIQDALRSSEAYLSEAQRVAHLGTWVWRVRDRQSIYVSEEWYRIYGFDSAEGPPSLKRRLERVHPEDRERYVSSIERGIAERADYEIEYRIVLPEGAVKYLRAVGHPFINESGELVNFVGIVGDVTERKLAEMALHGAMEERMRLAAFREDIRIALSRQEDLREILASCAASIVRHLDAAFARIWTVSSDGRVLELQASAGMYTNLHGAHSRIGLGQMKIGRIAQQKKPHLTNDAQNDPQVSDREWARRENMVSFAGYPLVIEERIVGVLGMFARQPLSETILESLSFAAGIIAQGIERKRAEEALRRSEEYLAEGQRLTHVGSWSVNVATQQALHSSEEHTRLFGLDPEKGVPTFGDFLQRVHAEDRQHVLDSFETAIRKGGDLDFHYRISIPGSAIRYMHAIGHSASRQGGNADEYVGITIDITDRKRADQERERLHQLEADLAHMNRVTTLGELTASLAHEVNQPITAAMTSARTCVRWLARDPPNVGRAREAAARIVDVTDRAARIIDRTRRLFKKGTPERQPVDLNEVVTDIVAMLRDEASRQHIVVRMELARDLPVVMGDRIQLQQVVMNLMTNALEAMNEADGLRELVFQSRREADDRVLISVSDTGIGLPPRADEIFSPFFTTKTEGTGMGLAISRSIIDSHGGQLWASSNAERGAAFHFTLPVAAEASHSAARS